MDHVVQQVPVIELLLLYWIVPIATWGLFINRIRVIAEHYPVNAYGDGTAFSQKLRTRDVVPSLFDRLFVTTRNVNLHLSHHMFPAVPFYNLEKLHAEISASEAPLRSGARRSWPATANRQVNSLPSADSRARVQPPQNGRVTEAMTPISPMPSL